MRKAQAAGECRRAEHEQQIADDRPGERRLHDGREPFRQYHQRDNQLGRVAEGRVEKSAEACAGVCCELLGRATQPAC